MKRVVIVIEGGAVQSVIKPKGIELEIRDYDVQQIDAEQDPRCKLDKKGDWYQEMLWEADTVERGELC